MYRPRAPTVDHNVEEGELLVCIHKGLLVITIATATAVLGHQSLSGREDQSETTEPNPPPTADLGWNASGEPTVVYFDFDGARLDDEARQQLGQLIASLRPLQVGSVEIVGHSDRAGPASYNERLAGRRAEQVAEALDLCGFGAEQIKPSQQGESMPAVATADGVPEPKNRRVEITVTTVNGETASDVDSAPIAPAEATTFVIYFDLDKAQWRSDAKGSLADMLAHAARVSGGQMVIAGHTDRSGTDAYNQDLSQRRAKAVADAVAVCGLNVEQVHLENHGEDEPAIDTADGVPEPRNRRVEITIRPG